MPRLRFREQGLDPDLAFPHCLGIPLRVVIAAHPVEKGLLQAPPYASAALRCRALGTKRAGGAGRGRGFVHPSPGRLALGEEPQALAPGTVVGISRHVVDEIGRTKETGPAPDYGQREIRTNLLTLDGGNVLDRAVLAVSGHLAWPQLPAEPRPPEQIEGGLVFLYLRRSHQGGEDDPGAAAIDEVVVLIAQPRASFSVRHRRGIGIGRAGPEIGCAPVRTARRRSVRATGSANPIVALRSTVGELGACFVRQVDRQPRQGLDAAGPVGTASSVATLAFVDRRGKEAMEMCFDGE